MNLPAQSVESQSWRSCLALRSSLHSHEWLRPEMESIVFLVEPGLKRRNARAERPPAPVLVPSSTIVQNIHKEQRVGAWLIRLDENTNT